MDKNLILCAGSTAAARYVYTYLKKYGESPAASPSGEVTHLVLDVPSFEASGNLRLGGSPEKLLSQLPRDITVFGGNLNHPALAGYNTVDLLKDENYLAQNAYITAECALDVALPYLSVTLRHCPVLILGWGRIGKCLGQLLHAIGADLTIAARKDNDRAMIRTLGYRASDFEGVTQALGRFRLIFNTVPHLVLDREKSKHIHPDCVTIDLASEPGIAHDDVITARGLPGIHMPESSGALIARTVHDMLSKEV